MIDFRLCLVTDRTLCRSSLGGGDATAPLRRAVADACRAGVRAVQLREKDLEARDLFRLACGLRDDTARHGCRLLINERLDIALAAAADGVHCPEAGFPPRAAREILGPGSMIGVSCHSLEAVEQAERAGADFVFYGPVFPTRSKPEKPAGLGALREACESTGMPVFAIGGVTPERAVECVDAGARGVAVVSALLGVEDVGAAVRAFADAMGAL
jgi:thiamine-phosphate pyrophosphorylase